MTRRPWIRFALVTGSIALGAASSGCDGGTSMVAFGDGGGNGEGGKGGGNTPDGGRRDTGGGGNPSLFDGGNVQRFEVEQPYLERCEASAVRTSTSSGCQPKNSRSSTATSRARSKWWRNTSSRPGQRASCSSPLVAREVGGG